MFTPIFSAAPHLQPTFRRAVGLGTFLLAAHFAFAQMASSPEPTPASTTPSLTNAGVPNPQHTGTPFLRVWSAEEYGASPVNWHVTQHPGTGFIYAANNYGILEYDGAAWRLISAPDDGRTTTLVIDHAQNLWAAGDNISRLEPDATGLLRARSQLSRLPESSRTISSIVFSAAGRDFTAFASSTHVYIFPATGDAYALAAPARVSSLWMAGDLLQVNLSDGSMVELRERQLVASSLAIGSPIPNSGFVWIVQDAKPAGSGRWTLATNRGTLEISQGSPTARLLLQIPRELLADSQITAALILRNGDWAFASARTGLLIFNREGQLVRQVQRVHGLPGNRIDQLCEDREGGLWLAQRTGLTRIQLDSPFSLHGTAQGLDGGPRTLLRQAGNLFVGHNEGLAVSEPDGRFREIPGMRLGTNRLVTHASRLFVTSGSLREMRADLTLQALGREAFSPLIGLEQDPTRLLGGSSAGVTIVRLGADRVESEGRVAGVPGSIAHLVEADDGFVWASSPTGKVWRIDFRAGVKTDAPFRAYGEADGLRPAARRDEPVLFKLGGEIVLSSAQGMVRYDRTTDRFVPETRIEGLDAERLGATEISRDDQGTLWLRLGPPRRDIVKLAATAPGRWRMQPLETSALSGLVSNGLYADSAAHTVWVAGQGALVAIALDWQRAATPEPLRAFVRTIEAPDGAPLLDPRAPASETVLPARQEALRITFAAPTFAPDYRGRTGTLYRTKLEGLDPAWSDWSPDAHRDFTNLPYRDFVFQVQARDLALRTSEISTLAFTIAPPWWLTRWAFAAYALAAGLVVYAFIRFRTRALTRRNLVLESAVAARTAELHGQNQELARLNRLELDEKISARLAEEKARLEVLRYQLNPHFLFNALNSVCAQIIRSPAAARAMVVRLADFCRLTLHRPNATEAAMSVAEELALLRAYLEIEQARLGELLTVEVASDPAADSFRLPPFLVLPLVENAVKYGARTSVERLTVRLHVRCEPGGAIAIEVANTGTWLEPGAHTAPSHGIGLENLRQRLTRYFPSAHEFTTVAADGWVIMRLRLFAPLRD